MQATMFHKYSQSTHSPRAIFTQFISFTFRQGVILPGLTPNGRRVCLFRGIAKDMSKMNINVWIKLSLMAVDVRLKEEQFDYDGDIYIFDGSSASAGLLSKLSPAMMKKFFMCLGVNFLQSNNICICKYIVQFNKF